MTLDPAGPLGNHDALRGSAPARIDEKSRLKVPTIFRGAFQDDKGPDVFVTSLAGDSVRIYPMPVWLEIERKLSAMPSNHPSRLKFLDRVNYYGQMVEMDGQGRLLLPQLLREAAQLKGEVAVTGNLSHLVVRNLEGYRAEIEEQPFTPEDEKTLDDLGI